jgi:glycosyltransferase involved in cell wall biosynthesis
MKIGLLTDFPAVEYCNGPALASQAYRRNMEGRGHEVSFIGPRPKRSQRQVEGDGNILFSSMVMKRYANTPFAMPWPLTPFKTKPDFDVVHGNSNGHMMHYGLMMREMYDIPCLQTNTIYLPAFKSHMIPEEMLNGVGGGFFDFLSNYVEDNFRDIYGSGDGVIVQCKGLVDYWREKGLTVPLHIIPRPIDVRSFDRPLGADPFHPDFEKGKRLFVACRHAGEKSLDQLLRIFAEQVLPVEPKASLSLLGDGPAHAGLIEYAHELGIWDRVQFLGERPHRDLALWYKYADVFAYPSVSETFGQVISEALWMGCPVVGFDDKMGMAFQVEDGVNGRLVQKGPSEEEAFGAAILQLVESPALCSRFGAAAARRQRELCHPDRVYAAYERAYEAAQEHLRENPATLRNRSKPRQLFSLFKDHALPWTWKTLAVIGAGHIPASGRYEQAYVPRKDVRFDAAPEVFAPQTNPGHLRVLPGTGGVPAGVGAPYKSRVAR